MAAWLPWRWWTAEREDEVFKYRVAPVGGPEDQCLDDGDALPLMPGKSYSCQGHNTLLSEDSISLPKDNSATPA
ncbi:unnamed protein product [Larinioides sclopetarius]|uniref:Uncharacterized protein n=1 Tax=Larinioides sclopetarius TaxID=280406 RepID=A0AAV2B2N9_9ARAC